MMNVKLPPQAIDIEQAIIGEVLYNGKSIEHALEIITDDSFYKDEHREIFKACTNLYKQSNPINLLTVKNELTRMKKLEYVGGQFALAEFLRKADPNIDFNCLILAERYVKRSLIMMSMGVQEESYKDETDAFDVLEMGQQMIEKIEKSVAIGKIDTVLDLFYESEKRNNEIINRQGLSGVPSGFTEIDKITGGFQKSDLILLAARPAMGKTSLMLNFVRNAAVEFKEPVACFSLEMSAMQLMHRLQSSETGIPLEKFMRIGLTPDEVEFNHKKCEKLATSPIYIDDTAGLSIFELKVKLRKLVREKGVKMAVIDYVQLMTVGKGVDVNGREQEISYISRNLKAIAKDLNIPIVALSQLSRKVEERADRLPMLSDLRESGSLEQDADIVMFIYRPDYYGITEDEKGNSTVGKAVILIEKHRNGATAKPVIGFKHELVLFHNLVDDNPFAEEAPVITNNLKPSNEF
jgi:replicative DNA helicase